MSLSDPCAHMYVVDDDDDDKLNGIMYRAVSCFCLDVCYLMLMFQ